MRGPAARFAYDPAVLVAFLDAHTQHRLSGPPARTRRYLNGALMSDSDVRVVRRWRSGTIQGVTYRAGSNLLGRYGFHDIDFHQWAADQGLKPVLRGSID